MFMILFIGTFFSFLLNGQIVDCGENKHGSLKLWIVGRISTDWVGLELVTQIVDCGENKHGSGWIRIYNPSNHFVYFLKLRFVGRISTDCVELELITRSTNLLIFSNCGL